MRFFRVLCWNKLTSSSDSTYSTIKILKTKVESYQSFNVDASDPLNQSLMVDIDDAESIRRLVELGFEESNAIAAFIATGRNLDEAIEILRQNTSD